MREAPVGLELEKVDSAPLLGPYPAKLAMDMTQSDKKIPIARLLLSFTVAEGQEVKYAVAVPGRMYVNGCENLLKYAKCDDLMKQFLKSTSFNIWIREMAEPRKYKSTDDVWDLEERTVYSKGRDGRKKFEKVDESKKISVLHYVVMLAPEQFSPPSDLDTKLRDGSGFQAENMSFAKYWNFILSKCMEGQTTDPVDQNWFIMSDVGFTGFSPSSVPCTDAAQDTGKISEVIRPFGGTIALKAKKLALFHKSALIINGQRVAFTEKMDVKVGQKVEVDIVPNKKEDGGLYVEGFSGDFIATTVYVGARVVDESKELAAKLDLGDSPNNGDFHKLVFQELYEDEDGMYSSGIGMITLSRLMSKGKASESMIGEYAKFSNKDLFYAGVNLKGVDLAWIARSGDMIDVKLSMMDVKDGKAQYNVDSGHFSLHPIAEMIVPELLFKKEFYRSLEIRDLDFATIEQIVYKKLGCRQKSLPENFAVGEVVSLEKPEAKQKISNATINVKYGKHKGKKIKLNRAKLSLFGISLAEIDLSYCLNSHETVYVDVSCIDDYPEGMYVAQYCQLISPCSTKVESLEELSPKDKVDFVCWMQSHHISYSLYKDVMEDKAPLRLYIPFAKYPCHGNMGLWGNVVSLDPSISRYGIMCGTIKIAGGHEMLDDPKGDKGMLDLKGALVTFNRVNLWVYGRKMAKADISYVLQPDQRISLEVERLTDEERAKFRKNIPLSNDVKYKATIAWIGCARPRNDRDDPNKNDKSLFDWLGARGLNMKSFQRLVDGQLPPTQPNMLGLNNFALAPNFNRERERDAENEKAMQELESTLPDVPVLRHGPLVVHMIETCINSPGPHDPRLMNLIDSEKTAQVAFHVSEALRTSLDHFRKRVGNMPMMGGNPMMGANGGPMGPYGGPMGPNGGPMGPNFGGPDGYKRYPGDDRGFGFRTNKRFKR